MDDGRVVILDELPPVRESETAIDDEINAAGDDDVGFILGEIATIQFTTPIADVFDPDPTPHRITPCFDPARVPPSVSAVPTTDVA